jgi:hypothetical protein
MLQDEFCNIDDFYKQGKMAGLPLKRQKAGLALPSDGLSFAYHVEKLT